MSYGPDMQSAEALQEEELQAIREEFPILQREVEGRRLVYLDNAATSQKPRRVIERLRTYYERENANIHRGVHRLSQEATEAYEGARARVGRFIGAGQADEVVFTKGATEAINLVAGSLGQGWLRSGDCILLTRMEHHANIVPWQLLETRLGVRLVVAEVEEDGSLDVADFQDKLEREKPRLVALVHMSNALGTINPARELVAMAHEAGARVLLDASQSVPHLPVDVGELDCDWLVFSGHKALGPTGIGVLYGKAQWLEEMPPYQGGGDMIEKVSFGGTVFKDPPTRFEAGTPPIAQAIALAEAVDYLREVDRERLAAHEAHLLEKATAGLRNIPGLRIYGEAADKASVLSFTLDCAHPHDIATILDAEGIAVRTGHHCAQPLMERFGISGTARASFAFYNTEGEADQLVRAVARAREFFG